MKYKLVKIKSFSGNRATIYTFLRYSDNKITLFDEFVAENLTSFKSEIQDILKRLKAISDKTGTQEHFFKLKEGVPGDGVCALYDRPKSNLRLYCIRNSNAMLILGGGGHKPKYIRALQDDEKLKSANFLLRKLSEAFATKVKDKDIEFTNYGFDVKGDLIFEIEDDES